MGAQSGRWEQWLQAGMTNEVRAELQIITSRLFELEDGLEELRRRLCEISWETYVSANSGMHITQRMAQHMDELRHIQERSAALIARQSMGCYAMTPLRRPGDTPE